jgi:hypothetical protein
VKRQIAQFTAEFAREYATTGRFTANNRTIKSSPEESR